MNTSDIVSLLTKYASAGILVDTNILLVYVVGKFDVDRIERFKRTNTFTRKDFAFLLQFVKHFHRIVTTPHVLTEVSNLAANLAQPHRRSCFEIWQNGVEAINFNHIRMSGWSQ